MGIIRRGILGGFSGKVANIVGSSWKGIAVMRSLPLSVANPRTPRQVAQRDKFSMMSKFSSQLLSVWIKPLWDRGAQQMSGYNAFVRENIDKMVLGGQVRPTLGIMSRGVLGSTQLMPQTPVGQVQTVTWDTALSNSLQSASDLAYIVLVEDRTGLVVGHSSGLVARSAGTASITFDSSSLEDTVYAFLAFANTDGTRIGDSTFVHTNIV